MVDLPSEAGRMSCRRDGFAVEYGPVNAVAAHSVAERVSAEAQDARGAQHIAACGAQSVADFRRFMGIIGFRRGRRQTGGRRRSRYAELFEQRGLDSASLRKQSHSLEQMTEFANVPRPGVIRKPGAGAFAQFE